METADFHSYEGNRNRHHADYTSKSPLVSTSYDLHDHVIYIGSFVPHFFQQVTKLSMNLNIFG